MKRSSTLFVGLDVHKAFISMCWLVDDGQNEETREIPNEPRAIARIFKKLAGLGEVRACYEAGPCGYEVRRQLDAMGIHCAVIAPSLIPRRPGDRVKTDRRDARKLARLYRAGELTPIHVPSTEEESVRDLLRCREDLVEDRVRQRHRLLKFLLRHGRIWRETKNWSAAHWVWLRAQRFEEVAAQRTLDEYVAQLDFNSERISSIEVEIARTAESEPWKPLVARLRCLRGISCITALTFLAEIQDFRRFRSPRQLMSFVGMTPSIHASGGVGRPGSITKSGNAHVRRVLVEAAWQYRFPPQAAGRLNERCAGQPEHVVEQARRAQARLHSRYRRLVSRGKPPQIAVVAVGRELLGFVWAILVEHETAPERPAIESRPRRKATRKAG
jgi:transposase